MVPSMITTHVDDERRRLREGRNAYTPCAADGCERSPHTGHPLFRVNNYGVEGIFMCAEHKAEIDAPPRGPR